VNILEVKDLLKIYRKGETEIPAIDHLNFSVQKGDFLSIIGRSGSGKSTLLNLIGGLDSPTGGAILFKGKDISRLSRRDLAAHRRNQVGMIFQSFNLIYSRNALENVILAMIFNGIPGKERKKRAIHLLEQVGLGGRIYHRPDELSGGETQRVAIARALANDPEMILADEPTGNLDSQTALEIIGLLNDLNQNYDKTVLMITHDQQTAKHVSDRMIRLLDGKIIEDIEKKSGNEIR
jgi:putative ABC transport system ATP-binding protein